MYPVDAIKVRVPRDNRQASPLPILLIYLTTQTRMQLLSSPSISNGVAGGGARILTGESFMSLWRGVSSVVAGAGMHTASPGFPAPLADK